MPASFISLSDCIGAELTGVDLSLGADSNLAKVIEAALVQDLVLVIRDQRLTPTQLLQAVAMLGPIMPQHLINLRLPGHPEIVVLDSRNTKAGADGKVVPIGARDWHTDHAHQERPPNFTALYALRLPDRGGDTSFANMQAAFASLPKAEQAELETLTIITKIDDRYSSNEDAVVHAEPRRHPLVRTHPVTGRKAIYFHPGMVARIDGMTAEESRLYLERLLDRAIEAEFIYRHQWELGDLVIMDNRGQMHVAHTDYDFASGRTLHRVLVEGEVPY